MQTFRLADNCTLAIKGHAHPELRDYQLGQGVTIKYFKQTDGSAIACSVHGDRIHPPNQPAVTGAIAVTPVPPIQHPVSPAPVVQQPPTMPLTPAVPVASPAVASPSGSSQTNNLIGLKYEYEEALVKTMTAYETVVQGIGTSYSNTLIAVAEQFKKQGSLEPLLATIKEQKRFTAEHQVPDAPSSGLPMAIRQAQNAYHAQVAAAAKERDKSVVGILNRYLVGLDELKRELTRQGKVDEATRVLAEFDDTKAKLAQFSPQSPQSIVVPVAPSQLPPQVIAGSFYVSVDDSATIYINGTNVMHAPLNQSKSRELSLRVGDWVIIDLRNKVAGRRFKIAFLSTDKRLMVSFAQRDLRTLPLRKAASTLTLTDFANGKPAHLDSRGGRPLSNLPEHIQDHSDWVWGEGKHCRIGVIINPSMVTPVPSQ